MFTSELRPPTFQETYERHLRIIVAMEEKHRKMNKFSRLVEDCLQTIIKTTEDKDRDIFRLWSINLMGHLKATQSIAEKKYGLLREKDKLFS